MSQRIFDSVFPDMFQVRVYSKNTKLVKMISADLPAPDSDPPDKNEVTDLTPDDLIREVFGVYKGQIEREITARGNEEGIGRLGVWLAQLPGWKDRWAVASLGQKGTKVVLKALGFRVTDESGPGAKVTNPP